MKIILDSGAFTADKKGTKIDIDAYVDYIQKMQGVVDHFVNLDVIGDDKASYHNWIYLRRKGIETIPVFHIGTDEKYLKKYLKQTDYIAVGAIAALSAKLRVKGLDRVFKDYFVDEKGLPIIKVHGLGLTAELLMRRYNWYSVDSSSIGLSAAMGKVYLPRLRRVENGFIPEWNDLLLFDMSNQRPVATKYSIPKMGVLVRKAYEQLMRENGFEMGELGGVIKKRSKRAKSYSGEENLALFGVSEESHQENATKKTLTSDHMQRFLWNLFAYRQMIQTLPKWQRVLFSEVLPGEGEERMHLHLVTIPFDYMEATEGKDDILFSYVYMDKKREELFKKWKNESK